MAKSSSKSAPKSTAAKRRAHAAKSQKAAKTQKTTKVAPAEPKVDGLAAYPQAAAKAEASKINAKPAKLPAGWQFLQKAYAVIAAKPKLFAGITAIYAFLSFILVQSITGSLTITTFKMLLDESPGRIAKGMLAYDWLMSGSGSNGSPAAGVYAALLLLIISLALIWALRQVTAGTPARIRDAFYRGLYPVVPVFLVSLVLLLKLLPLLVGFVILNAVLSVGIAGSVFSGIIWVVFALGLCLLSLLWATPTVIAIYIATLPEMTPMTALRNGRELVRYRRLAVLRKLIFLILVLMIAGAIIMLPVLLLLPIISPWLLFLGGIVVVPIFHAYAYSVYRELLV